MTGGRSSRGLRGRRRGQATVELVLVLPVVVLALLLVVQVGLVVRAQVLVVAAAREGARSAAVDPAPGVAERAARSTPGLDPDRLAVHQATGTGATGSRVRVAVRYRCPTVVPLVGDLVGEPTLTADATMAVEGTAPPP